MMKRFVCLTLLLALGPGCASVADRMIRGAERGAKRAAERETQRRTDDVVTRALQEAEDAVVCLMTDAECIARAQREGKAVEVVNAEGDPADSDIPPQRRPFWRLSTGGETREGSRHLVDVTDDRMLIQLVHKDNTNLVLMVPEPGDDRRETLAAYYTAPEGMVCGLTGPSQPLTVELLPTDGPWLRGTYVGTLMCPDLSSQVVQGYFHVRRPGD